MKVVIFCGGLGVRMGEQTNSVPKPMIRIGNRPMLWHIMQYYASWGHTEFILCLGYKSEVIKEYFLHHEDALTNDFVLEQRGGGRHVEVLTGDRADWRITFADTGINATIGERLKAVASYIGDDEEFLATYGDGLSDVPLPEMIEAFHASKKLGMFLSVRPEFNAHLVVSDSEGTVSDIQVMNLSDVRINGGFFIFKRQILDWIEPGHELVEETFARLVPLGEIGAYRYDGFFGPMDTIKDRQRLEALYEGGAAPWTVRRAPG